MPPLFTTRELILAYATLIFTSIVIWVGFGQ